jgi:hypothetical protein
MTKWLLSALLGSSVVLGAAATSRTSEKVTCTLTNQTVESCCCVEQKDGTLYCTLAKTLIDSCCCKPADEKS